MKQLHAQPVLRMQEFNALSETTFLVRPPKWHVSVQFLVDGQWVTLSQILK
jgi:transglutaminase-like putative cysteine protease